MKIDLIWEEIMGYNNSPLIYFTTKEVEKKKK